MIRYPTIGKQITASLFVLFISSCLSFGQETKKFNLSFVVPNAGSKKYLKQLDSVSLRNEITGEYEVFSKMQTTDSIFKIPDVELGKYRIVVFQKNMIIPFADFSVCTSCGNKIRLIAYLSLAAKKTDKMWIGPFYEKGFKQLSDDFLSAITSEEKKILKKSDNKLKVKCFITAGGKLSDVIFEEADLPADLKSLVKKGLEKCKAWISALINGKPGDDYISLSVSKLVD